MIHFNSMNTSKNILIGITGAIAAYKSVELVRLLRAQGKAVRVVLTESAQSFVTPTTLQAISGHPVVMDLFHADTEAGMPHIDLARWADIILIAPASADFIARLAQGHANDLLTTICLATQSPIIVAPSMNRQMWENTFVQKNVANLKAHGIQVIQPEVGEQACGEYGPGRMPEPETLAQLFLQSNRAQAWKGIKVLITAGPTQEAIDPARFLSNRSSGKMGYALAEAAKAAGADVTVISGPTSLTLSPSIHRINVTTAAEMHGAVMVQVNSVDFFIAAAAVSDFGVEQPNSKKIKKSGGGLILNLVENLDIVKSITSLETKPFVVGFCLETDNLIESAKIKMREKNMDAIVANHISSLESEQSEATLLFRDGEQKTFSSQPKSMIAHQLIEAMQIHLRRLEGWPLHV